MATTTTFTETTTSVPVTSTSLTSSTTLTPSGTDTPRPPLVDLDLTPGQPIDEPEAFGWLSSPDVSAGELPSPTEYPRARISSRVEIADALPSDPELAQLSQLTITYYDGYTIWDYPDGYREARRGSGDYMYLNDDGAWQVSDRFEWPPFGPLPEWFDAQWIAGDLLEQEHEVEGYELLAGIETAHVRWGDAAAEQWADVWVDSSGTVVRMVLDMASNEEDPLNQLWMIWDVLTLDPQDIGPLPPG